MVVVVVRGHVIIDVLSSSSIIVVDGLWVVIVSRVMKGWGRYSPIPLIGDDACHRHHLDNVAVPCCLPIVQLLCYWCVQCWLWAVDNRSGQLAMVVGVGGCRQGGEAAAGGSSWKMVVVEDEAVEHY